MFAVPSEAFFHQAVVAGFNGYIEPTTPAAAKAMDDVHWAIQDLDQGNDSLRRDLQLLHGIRADQRRWGEHDEAEATSLEIAHYEELFAEEERRLDARIAAAMGDAFLD